MKIKRSRTLWGVLVVLPMLLGLVLLAGCTKTMPEEYHMIIANLKEGFNDEDIDLFCADFMEMMYTSKSGMDYLQMIRANRKEHGMWKTEKYKGKIGEEHIWKIKCIKGSQTLALVINHENEIISLSFR